MKIKVKSYWKREDGWAATTTALVMAGIAAAGTAVSTIGSISSSQAQQKMQKYNASVEENNAVMASQQASAEADLVKEKNRRQLGSQRAMLAAAGLDIDSSSASDLETDSIISGELNRLTGLYRGNIRATDSRAQAEQSRAGAKNARTAGYFNTASTFLSGASNAYYSYERIKTNPRFED
jgi:hypothetical protein